MNRRQVSGVLLAAGESTRMGEGCVKQLLPFDGEPLVRRTACEALASCLCEVVVVVGFASDEVRQALAGLDVRVVDNPDYRAGQSTSVRAGLAAVDPAADAAMFLPVDHPFLTAHVIDRLIAAYQDAEGAIVLPVYENRRGAPVLLDRSIFPELAQLTGDEGGRQIFQQYAGKIVTVPLDSERPLLDVDTPEAYQEFVQDGCF
ncbi:MAG: Nicotine blue oxidoreductase [Anaerolineales bacterium]|nr:Nicotine blue oxidoreductase [Anaerolineales bacterium]